MACSVGPELGAPYPLWGPAVIFGRVITYPVDSLLTQSAAADAGIFNLLTHIHEKKWSSLWNGALPCLLMINFEWMIRRFINKLCLGEDNIAADNGKKKA